MIWEGIYVGVGKCSHSKPWESFVLFSVNWSFSFYNLSQFLSIGIIRAPMLEPRGTVREMIPGFNGKEGYWWLVNAEQYFENRLPEEMELSLVCAFAIRGKALKWWVSWKESNHNATRWTFEKAVLKQIQPELGHFSRPTTTNGLILGHFSWPTTTKGTTWLGFRHESQWVINVMKLGVLHMLTKHPLPELSNFGAHMVADIILETDEDESGCFSWADGD